MIYKTEGNQIVYDFQNTLSFIELEGRKMYGDNFALKQEDMPIICKVFACVVNDEVNILNQGLDPRKGIMICGPVGVGKTSLLFLSRFLLPEMHRYQIKSCRDVSFEFHKNGYDVINRYSKNSFHIVPGKKIPKIICFDDLGAEQNLKHYGNNCNVMAEILLSRYDLFISEGLKTYITTNLNAEEIEKHYGARVRSRLREMVNVISFSAGAKDKRR